jgi:hypothetical protein
MINGSALYWISPANADALSKHALKKAARV